jgi:hypothetical protein
MFLAQVSGKSSECCVGLSQGDLGSQTGKHVEVMVPSHSAFGAAKTHGPDQIGGAPGFPVCKLRRHHTHNRHGLSVQPQGATDDVVIGIETAQPKGVVQQHDVVPPRLILIR